MIERDELGHVFLSTVPELLCGLAIKRPFASHIQIFDNHCRRFAVRADSKGDTALADCVFAFRFIGEYVPVIVLQRES